MKPLSTLVLVLFLAIGFSAKADEQRPEHFEGEPAETLEQALANFSEYNDKLAAILAKDELSPKDLYEVHQLTYTLENALDKIRNEYEDLAETLEEVHVASEHNDTGTVKSSGKAYLDAGRQLVPTGAHDQ